MADFWSGDYAYAASAVLLLIGLYAVVVKRNLVKKLIGLSIMQSAIILIWVATATRPDSTVPVLETEGHGPVGAITATAYANPLPQTLMLTAIVVGVATVGVAFALLISIHRRYGTLDEAELLRTMQEGGG
jgi:multicomponent Na+:H+ antiporter subunit C